MTTSHPVQSFKCPSCGAPLEIETGKATMKCPYCGETVVVPESLRASAQPVFESPPQRPIAEQAYTPVQVSFNVEENAPKVKRGSCGGIIAALFAIVVVIGIIFFAFGFNPFGKFLFANKVMTFGSEGIGPGMFQDARAIGVDGNGNIVVADYKDGRIQVFSPDGKFISMFTVKDDQGKAVSAMSIAVSRDGKIYVPNGDILIFDESGQLVGKIASDMQHMYETAVTLSPDGTVYALTFGEDNLVHFKADSSIDFEVPSVVESVTGGSGGFPQLAVDGLGNIYITADNPPAILKYSPQGKFVDQFGGEAKDAGQFEPGKFVSPMGIAIDGYGRIFVNDFYDLQVFDSTGKYLNDISGGYYGIAFDAQNNLYTTPVEKYDAVKFQIQTPAQP